MSSRYLYCLCDGFFGKNIDKLQSEISLFWGVSDHKGVTPNIRKIDFKHSILQSDID